MRKNTSAIIGALLLLSGVLVGFTAHVVAADESLSDTGALSVSVGENVNISNRSWYHPEYITSSDSSRAVVYNIDNSNILRGTDIGASVPAGKTIVGVLVEIEHSQQTLWGSPNHRLDAIQLVSSGSAIGTAKGIFSYTNTVDTYASFGSSSDTWGATLTPAIVNSPTFGVQLQSRFNDSGSGYATCRINHIRITVYYTD